MPSKKITDRHGRIIGYTEENTTGNVYARDRFGRLLGMYNPNSGITTDRFGKTVARGDITGGLVWNSQDNYKKNKK